LLSSPPSSPTFIFKIFLPAFTSLMAPVKSAKASTSSEPSNPRSQGLPKHKHHKRTGHESEGGKDTAPNPLPGVQKIKAALRQTRRLLSKDKLAADVRTKTERRLKGLEKDLAEAERRKTERTMATRYHKVKFFERQKVVRKINKTKRLLEDCSDKAEKKQLKKALFSLRVDLNYILHYPKSQKYISLFPPEVRQGQPDDLDSDSKGKAKTTGVDEKSETDTRREEIRKWMKEGMERGELSQEPEAGLGTEDGADSGVTQISRVPIRSSGEKDLALHNEDQSHNVSNGAPAVNEDAFFGEDSEGDEMTDS